MTIKTETRELTVELRMYDGNEWSYDLIDDLGPDFRLSHPGRVPGSDTIIASDEDTDDLVDYWAWEVEAANKGMTGEVLNLSDDERANGHEYDLTVTIQ